MYKRIIVLLNLVLLLLYFNHSVIKNEELLESGQFALLELAPVDPRSLMQGDYMALRYKISEDIHLQDIPKRGYCVVRIDSGGVAGKIRLQKEINPLNEGEYLIKYTSSDDWNVNIGAESFFFQEGQAEKYEKAKYGGLKIDRDGNSLLIGLYDEHQMAIE